MGGHEILGASRMGKVVGWGRSLKWANWVHVNNFVSRWLDSGFEGPRGRKSIEFGTCTEEILTAWLEERWKLEQRVTCTMIFRNVLDIDPKFKGSVKADGYFDKLKKWFYYGSNVRHNLSVSTNSSVRQKLPLNWEQKLLDLHGKVCAIQKPELQA